jgi:hypothetical protein
MVLKDQAKTGLQCRAVSIAGMAQLWSFQDKVAAASDLSESNNQMPV